MYNNIEIDGINLIYKENDIEYNIKDLVKFVEMYKMLWDHCNEIGLLQKNTKEKYSIIEGIKLKV
jgi:hypothetical protein